MATSHQSSLLKAYGALKDSTNVGLARVNGDYKGLEVAIFKATNHKEALPKEKHVRTILFAVSGKSPRIDVYNCIRHLLKRLHKTHTWTVALKIMLIFHRALREVDPSFILELSELIQCRGKGYRLSFPHFTDTSSSQAREYSAWIRKYNLYIEERLECFHLLNYDVNKDQSRNRRLSTRQLLEQLPVLQELLQCLLACRLEGAAFYNLLIHYVLSIIADEGVKLYIAITDGLLNLVDKYFEMQRYHAVKALEIYRRAANQASQLSEFFEICRSLHYGQRQKYLKIKLLPESFLTAMEDYLKETPEVLALPYKESKGEGDAPTEALSQYKLVIYQKKDTDVQEEESPSVTSSDQTQTDSKQGVLKLEIGDLLSFDDPVMEGSELDQNPLALPLVEPENPSNAGNDASSAPATTGWELELFGASSSNGEAVAENKLTGELDRLTLDSLYDQAIARTTDQDTCNFSQVSTNPFDVDYNLHQFHGSGNVTPITEAQMAAMAQQQIFFIQQQLQPHPLMVGNSPFEVNYNQGPPYGSSDFTTPTDAQMAPMAQQQTCITTEQQQPQPPTVVCDSTIPSGNPFLEQSVPSHPPVDS